MIDPEPPPRSRRQVALLVGAVVAGAAVVAFGGWAVLAAAGRSTPTGAVTSTVPALHLPGQVLVFDSSTGRLGTAAPDGSQFRSVAGPGFPGNTAQASPDGRHVMVGLSQVVDLGPGGEVVHPPLNGRDSGAVLQPWADGGKRIVLMTAGGPDIDAVTTVDPDGGAPHDLGRDAGAAAGDPTRDGAVVAVQGDTEVDLGDYTQRDTSRVELRWWKGHSILLAATADLVRVAGLPRGVPYAVWPVIAPDGQHVALTVDALKASPNRTSARQALIVTDRSGRVIVSQSSYTSIEPLWGHDSRQVAYTGSDGITLLTVTGERAVTRTLPAQVEGRACLFSPADDYLLCDDLTGGDRTIIRLSDGHLDHVHHDPTQVAVAWLPATELPSPGGSRT